MLTEAAPFWTRWDGSTPGKLRRETIPKVPSPKLLRQLARNGTSAGQKLVVSASDT
jgi:hypothetical protein